LLGALHLISYHQKKKEEEKNPDGSDQDRETRHHGLPLAWRNTVLRLSLRKRSKKLQENAQVVETLEDIYSLMFVLRFRAETYALCYLAIK
jgi:hypothetical protein